MDILCDNKVYKEEAKNRYEENQMKNNVKIINLREIIIDFLINKLEKNKVLPNNGHIDLYSLSEELVWQINKCNYKSSREWYNADRAISWGFFEITQDISNIGFR